MEANPVEAAPAPRGRSTGKVVAAAVGAVAIVGAGIFAITRLAGDASASGGADSPEAAADMLLDALDSEDVLGAVDVLLPGERETFRQPLQDVVAELQRLEVLSDDDLSGVSGVDITVTDRNVASTPTNVDDIVNLDVTATVASSVDGAALPIGEWIRENVEADEIDSIDETSEPTEGRFPVTAVRQDGRWYLSLFYTAAEQARAQTDLDIPAEGVPLNGGESPEAAMDNALAALADLDLTGLVGTLNPNEFEALQRYAPLFLDDAQRQLDDAVSESGVSIDVRDTAYTVDGDGSRRGVTITAMAVDITAEGETLTARLEDGCFLVQVPGQDEVSSCDLTEQLGDEVDLDDVVDDPQAVEDAIADVQAAFEEYENPGIIVQEVDGSWYLSPMATVSDQVLAVVRALDRDEIEDLTTQLQDLAATFDPDMVVGGVEVPDFDDFELPRDDPTPTSVPERDDPSDTVVADTIAATRRHGGGRRIPRRGVLRGVRRDRRPGVLRGPPRERRHRAGVRAVVLPVPGVRRRRHDVERRPLRAARRRVRRRHRGAPALRAGADRIGRGGRLRVRRGRPAAVPGRPEPLPARRQQRRVRGLHDVRVRLTAGP